MTDRTLVFVLGDQLSRSISSLRGMKKENTVILMAEVHDEATYVRHHKKKIAFLFSAMRHFAEACSNDGWTVDYVRLDDEGNSGSFTGELERALKRHKIKRVRITEPSEYRVLKDVEDWQENLDCAVDIKADDRFIATHAEFAGWASGRKQLRMEYFYRDMRKKTGLLIDENGEPEGGKWNYDSENRKPADDDLFLPEPPRFEPDDITQDVLTLVKARFGNHFGDLDPFWFAVTADQADAALDDFIEHRLASFGDYQDAMLTGRKFLYHSILGLYINAGLLDPLKACQRAVDAYAAGHAPLNAVEGFIRQIIGWREFIRGVYWLKMPGYADANALQADRDLPDFYWTGATEMHCLSEAINQTREEAYAHHIQRLMVTGNFAMLIGVEPKQISDWYLAVYADAFEWVEMPNVIGMSQFADGGVVGSKPYASSGAYIDRMSNYCRSCRYNVKKKTGDGACPFNALYWDFLARNEKELGSNPRLGTIYASWRRMSDEKKSEYRRSASQFLSTLT